eukprot:CAMPEP_0197289444 /NCGR_PEP_ID=MMETSP0890-20130614/6715_1 /TAXON_ID=44058 ORGANISM="Aureoumbra lagunensis, Strain CCMP1510" /NCGR_SAMPLE_ID=MMETSP0890 /ASSEMBLY_ACC=CAM_ASM_000533 /LENGTH=419 /DNA_ID=CAMNT_0042760873 /DNA_START=25 /DNA_END=1281 /DNA_ORIENTATION=-
MSSGSDDSKKVNGGHLLHSKRLRWERLVARPQSSDRTRSVFAVLLSNQKGNLVHEKIIRSMALESPQVLDREDYLGIDPFSEDQRIPRDQYDVPYNHPLSESQQKSLEKKAQEARDNAVTSKRGSKIRSMWLMMYHGKQRKNQSSWSATNWNESSVDPAKFANDASSVNSQSKFIKQRSLSRSTSQILDSNKHLERKLQLKIESRLWSVFEKILRIGDECTKKGHILLKRDLELLENGHGKSSDQQNRQVADAASVFTKSEVRRRENIVEKSKVGNVQNNAEIIEIFHATDICKITDSDWVKRVCKFRQRSREFLRHSAQARFGRTLHHTTFRLVIFRCHLSAALRLIGVSITLDEIQAVWKEMIDECMHLRPPKSIKISGSKKAKSDEELSVEESIAFIRSDPVLKYEVLAADDFIAW